MKSSEELVNTIVSSADENLAVKDVVSFDGEDYEIVIHPLLNQNKIISIIDTAVANVLVKGEIETKYYPSVEYMSFWVNVIAFTTDIVLPEESGLKEIELLVSKTNITAVLKDVLSSYNEEDIIGMMYESYEKEIEYGKKIACNRSKFASLAEPIKHIMDTMSDKMDDMDITDIVDMLKQAGGNTGD